MENLSPALLLLLEVRTALENGSSVRTGVLQFLKMPQENFNETIAQWLLRHDQRQETGKILSSLSPCRRTLLILLEKGLNGMPILSHLEELEAEIIHSCEAEIEEHIQKLPLLLMIPIFFFLFPAYLILLFGPLLQSIVSQLQ